jgi:hypothetical protein
MQRARVRLDFCPRTREDHTRSMMGLRSFVHAVHALLPQLGDSIESHSGIQFCPACSLSRAMVIEIHTLARRYSSRVAAILQRQQRRLRNEVDYRNRQISRSPLKYVIPGSRLRWR